MMTTPKNAKTNWHLVIWPIVTVWIVAAIYVFKSDWREQASVVLPMFMAAGAFLVFLMNAIAGSFAQARLDTQHLDKSVHSCMGCGCQDRPLRIVEYYGYAFLITIIVQFGCAGKMCAECGRRYIDRMFRRTLWCCVLCPPFIVWAWIRRGGELSKFERD